MANIRACEMI